MDMPNLSTGKLLRPVDRAPVQAVSYGEDSSINARFDDEYVKNNYKSENEGRIIYDHMIEITLEYPGNNLSNYKERFTPAESEKGNQWTHRFAAQWASFKAQREQVPNGTPVELWPPIDKGRVLALKSLHIHTVEQIAALTDSTGPMIGMDWRKMRDMAKATLEPKAAQVEISKLHRENDDLKSKMEAIERQLSSLKLDSTSVTLQEPAKRRGRKPKRDDAGEQAA